MPFSSVQTITSMCLDCPSCGSATNKLIIPLGGKTGCRNCLGKEPTKYNANLNQTYTKDSKTRLTNGKAWEIANRIVSPDDKKTMINKVTGRPSQY